MPKGEFSTPGPYYQARYMPLAGRHPRMRRIEVTVCHRRPHGQTQFVFDGGLDKAERDELVGLLNKGTHFERMLDALRTIRDAAGEPIPEETLAMAPDDTAKDMMTIGFGVAFMSIQRLLLETLAAVETPLRLEDIDTIKKHLDKPDIFEEYQHRLSGAWLSAEWTPTCFQRFTFRGAHCQDAEVLRDQFFANNPESLKEHARLGVLIRLQWGEGIVPAMWWDETPAEHPANFTKLFATGDIKTWTPSKP